jgi:hypothetical protein
VKSEKFRARLAQEINSLNVERDGGLIDVDRYNAIVERLEFLLDSLAALRARDELETSLPWTKVRSHARPRA